MAHLYVGSKGVGGPDIAKVEAFEEETTKQETNKTGTDQKSNQGKRLQVGSRVRARYRAPNGKEYYDGKIDIVNNDGTYAIHYDDGDREGYPKGHKYYSKSLPGVLPSNIVFKGKILSEVDQKEEKKKTAESEGTTDDDCARRDGIMEVAAPLLPESSNGPGRIRAGTWHTVSVVVIQDKSATQNTRASTTIFVDGIDSGTSLVSTPSASSPSIQSEAGNADILEEAKQERSLLGLGRRIVLFGGGRQSDARGGAVRRLWITDRALARDEIAALARIDMPSANPLLKGAATCIQSAARRHQAVRLVKDLRKKGGLPETRENPKEAPTDSSDEDESE